MDNMPKSRVDLGSIWAWANIAMFFFAFILVVCSGRPLSEEISGTIAAFFGLLLLSLAGEFTYSGKFFLRTGDVVKAKDRPIGFWLIIGLLVIAGIRSLLLY